MSTPALRITLAYIERVKTRLRETQDITAALHAVDQLRRLRETVRHLRARTGAPS